MTACARPGCAGEIESGYCNVCGYPPPSPPSGRAGAVAGSTRGMRAGVGGGRGPSGQGLPAAGMRRDAWTAGTATGAAWLRSSRRTVAGAADAGARPARCPASRRRRHGAREHVVRSRGTSTVRTALHLDGDRRAARPVPTGSGGSRGNLGAGLVEMPSVPYRDPQSVLLVDPEVPERKRFCAHCDNPVGRSRGLAPGPHRGLLPARRQGVLLHAEAVAGRPRGRPVPGRRAASPTAGWVDLSGPGQERLGPLGRLEGPARRRRRIGHGGGDRGTAIPGRGGAPQHRQDLQLRRARRLRLHRHGIRRRRIAARGAHPPPRGGRAPPPGGPGDRLHPRDPPRHRVPAPPRPSLLRLQAGQRDPDRGAAQADRPRRRPRLRRCGERPVRHHRLPGARGAPNRVPASRRTSTPWRGRWRSSPSTSPASRTRSVTPCDCPPRKDVPAFQRYESFHRFLQKATGADPSTRFQSAGEMAEQLVGVLRQVVAIDGGTPAPAPSTLFSAELGRRAGCDARGSSCRCRRWTRTTRRPACSPPWPWWAPTSGRPFWRRCRAHPSSASSSPAPPSTPASSPRRRRSSTPRRRARAGGGRLVAWRA